MKKVIGVIVLVAILVALVGVNVLLICGKVSAQNQEEKNPVLSLEIENYGTVKIELYPDYAPNTVKNIIALANNGYYDGKVFYGMDDVAVYVGRDANGESVNPKLSDIDKSIVVTDENGNQTTTKEDYEYAIDGEFVNNQFTQNTLKHEKGVVSLVRADYTKQIESLVDESYNSGNSQFTIVMNNEKAKNLNGLYAAFGKVVEGLEIVEQINTLDVKSDDSEDGTSSDASIQAFATAPVITKATVETFDGKYGLPKVHEAFNYNNYLNELMTQYYTSQNQ